QTLPGARLIGGKQVLNVVPVGAPHKGDAVLAAMRHNHCRHALFVGDDITDEDGFALGPQRGGLVVRVRRRAASGARLYLASQGHVDAVLAYCLRWAEEFHREKAPPSASASPWGRRISSPRR